jgi:hypothetical protein
LLRSCCHPEGIQNEVMYDLFVKFERFVVRNWHPEAVNR